MSPGMSLGLISFSVCWVTLFSLKGFLLDCLRGCFSSAIVLPVRRKRWNMAFLYPDEFLRMMSYARYFSLSFMKSRLRDSMNGSSAISS